MIVYSDSPNFNQLTYEPITSKLRWACGTAFSISSFLRGAAGYQLTSWKHSFLTNAFKAAFLTAEGIVKPYTCILCMLLGTVSSYDPLGVLIDLLTAS